MHAAVILIAVAGLGVEYGYQPLDDRGIEYIVQIAPSAVAMTEDGDTFSSEVPPELPPVGRVVFRVGTGPLPRDLPPERADDSQREPGAAHLGAQLPVSPFDTPRGGRWQNVPGLLGEPEPEARSFASRPGLQADDVRPRDTRPDDAWANNGRERPNRFATEPVDSAEPRVIEEPVPGSQLIAHTAPAEPPVAPEPTGEDVSPSDDVLDGRSDAEQKPWFTFGAVLGLCLSLSANVYLGAVAFSAHRRYVGLLAETAVERPGDEFEDR